MPPVQFRVRTILLFIAVVAVLLAMPRIVSQLSRIRPFWLEWDGTTLWFVEDWVMPEIESTHGPVIPACHHLVKTEVALLPPLILLRIVAVASLLLGSALVCRRKLKIGAKLRETATDSGTSEPHAIDGQAPDQSGEAERV
jgi:hypothetical protein